MQGRRSFLFVAALLQAAFWIFVLRADFFGLSSASDRVSESVFLRLYPGLYPADWRERIQVVMLDEAELKASAPGVWPASKEWPLTFEDNVDLIRRVLKERPRGVFVDLLFDTEHGRNTPALQEFIDSLPDDSPPVVFASYGALSKHQLVAPLQRLPFAPVRGAKPALRGLAEFEALPGHYQLADGGGRIAPAAVLYNATLSTLNKEGGRFAPVATDAKSDMLVAWGDTLPPDAAADPACAPLTDDSESRWWGLGRALTLGLIGKVDVLGLTRASDGGDWQRLQPCLYHNQISATSFFDTGGAALVQREAIAGSYVFIGASVGGSGDTVRSPVHGQVPGVHFHAMALDNLLSFKGEHLTTTGAAEIPQMVFVFLFSLIGTWIAARATAPKGRAAAAATLISRGLVWLTFAAVVLGVSYAFLTLLHWAPFNWGSVLAIAGIALFADAGRLFMVFLLGKPDAEPSPRFTTLVLLLVIALLALASNVADAAEMGAIARFKKFPVDTFELNGMMSTEALTEADLPPPAEISVDGFWPSHKLLLISFVKGDVAHVHFIRYGAVAMADQARWDARMTASDTQPVCLPRPATGGAKMVTTLATSGATKGFTHPCY